MFSRSSLLHLRMPFSYFLLPVFLFSLALSPNLEPVRLEWVFFIIHFLLYPATNGYNSYYDKDEKSIGGLKNPPPVKKDLYYLSLLLDILAIALGVLFVNLTFAVMVLVYGLVSKAYSHPVIRIKKYAVASWLVAGTFQGFFTFLMCYAGINDFVIENMLTNKVLIGGLLTSAMLLANYPMTQVYQHEEDAKRGDITLSLKLGVRGTFFFVGGIFFIVFAGFFLYFKQYFNIHYSYVLLASLLPITIFFLVWFTKVLKNVSEADYTRTMWLNFISATCLNFFFFYFFLNRTHIANLFL